MKKATVVLLVLIGALCAMALSCASSGGGKAASSELGTGTLAIGEWRPYDDQEGNDGSSTSELTEAEEVIDGQTVKTYTVKGNITTKYQYGFAGWAIDPDEETFERFKKATGFSFKILGDGQRYTIKYKTTDCQMDHCYYEYGFNTEAGEVVYVEVPIKMFMQPSWGQWKRLNQNNVFGVEWQTHENWRKSTTTNPFEIKIWDFKVYN